MKKESLLNYLYRFFDIIVLLFIVFDFGYDFEENYNSPHVVGLILLSLGLLAFNSFKFFNSTFKSNKKVVLINMILLIVILASCGVMWLLNSSFSVYYILQKIKPVLEGGLILYFLLRLMVFVRHIYACASIVGAIACVWIYRLWGGVPAMVIGTVVVILIRYLAAHYRWNLPRLRRE